MKSKIVVTGMLLSLFGGVQVKCMVSEMLLPAVRRLRDLPRNICMVISPENIGGGDQFSQLAVRVAEHNKKYSDPELNKLIAQSPEVKDFMTRREIQDIKDLLNLTKGLRLLSITKDGQYSWVANLILSDSLQKRHEFQKFIELTTARQQLREHLPDDISGFDERRIFEQSVLLLEQAVK